MASILEDAEQNITPRMRMLLDRVWQEWKPLEIDITAVREEIERISNQDAGCQRLRQIPGVGPLVSTATVAAIGNGSAFRKGRASLPLSSDWCRESTPPGARQSSTAKVAAILERSAKKCRD